MGLKSVFLGISLALGAIVARSTYDAYKNKSTFEGLRDSYIRNNKEQSKAEILKEYNKGAYYQGYGYVPPARPIDPSELENLAQIRTETHYEDIAEKMNEALFNNLYGLGACFVVAAASGIGLVREHRRCQKVADDLQKDKFLPVSTSFTPASTSYPPIRNWTPSAGDPIEGEALGDDDVVNDGVEDHHGKFSDDGVNDKSKPNPPLSQIHVRSTSPRKPADQFDLIQRRANLNGGMVGRTRFKPLEDGPSQN